MALELIYEKSQFGEGWTAYDGEYRDSIPGTKKLSAQDFESARAAAVKAWGPQWNEATETPYDGSHTN